MNQFDAVGDWLYNVSYSHSQSKATEEQYKRVWKRFTSYIGKTAEQILADYEASDDRVFRRKYAQYIRAWIVSLDKEGLGITSIKVMVGAVKSFFKYNDLPLGLVPQSLAGTIYHNRDITKEEIVQIMAVSKIREKAFFAVMAQGGLRPHTIRQLKLRNFEPLDKVPCKIEVPKEITKGKFGSYVTFIGPDAIKYLKQYLTTRTNLAQDSLVFCSHDNSTKPVNVKDVSRAFRLGARKLEKTGALQFEVRQGKPSELRFYTLRKFFRKYANQMGFEHVNYVMGHTTKGSDSSYTPRDPEFYRELYTEKAMPFLTLETPTPTETTKIIATLKEQHQEEVEKLDNENKELRERLAKMENNIKNMDNQMVERLAQEMRILLEKLRIETAKKYGWDKAQLIMTRTLEQTIQRQSEDKEDYIAGSKKKSATEPSKQS